MGFGYSKARVLNTSAVQCLVTLHDPHHKPCVTAIAIVQSIVHGCVQPSLQAKIKALVYDIINYPSPKEEAGK